ncbi:MAG: GNAT family N-acetyltransferase, partial [Acidimicrobiales bacterium]
MTAPLQFSRTDGIVTIRSPRSGDAAALIAGRDEVFTRFLGPGSDDPRPTACIEAGGALVGWVDCDRDDRPWLTEGEANLGYALFPAARDKGLATRAVALLIHHLALTSADTGIHTVTALIDPENERSVSVVRRIGFAPAGTVDGQLLFRRPVHPISYTDGE